MCLFARYANIQISKGISPATKQKTKTNIIIEFISEVDNKNHLYYSCVNLLSGDRLSAFDSNPPSINQDIEEIKKIIGNIKRKAIKIINC